MSEKAESDKKKTYRDMDFAERQEHIKKMREDLARTMGLSNYFFYLEANIDSKRTGRF